MGQEPDPAQDPNDPNDPNDPAADPQPEPASRKPPWGDDDFDPDKAWRLLENVRGDVAKLKTERDSLAAKLQEHDDKDKSEAQKLQERAEAAEQKLAAAERNAMVASVALKKGLTEAQAKRLIGTTVEELEADADELLATFTPEPGQEPVPGRPRERLRPGAAPSAEPEETDPAKLAAMVPRRI